MTRIGNHSHEILNVATNHNLMSDNKNQVLNISVFKRTSDQIYSIFPNDYEAFRSNGTV